MPTYDVTFKVATQRTVRIDADDEDEAVEHAEDMLILDEHATNDVQLYGCSIAKKDDE